MELLTVTGLAGETGISRQALHKHLGLNSRLLLYSAGTGAAAAYATS